MGILSGIIGIKQDPPITALVLMSWSLDGLGRPTFTADVSLSAPSIGSGNIVIAIFNADGAGTDSTVTVPISTGTTSASNSRQLFIVPPSSYDVNYQLESNTVSGLESVSISPLGDTVTQ